MEVQTLNTLKKSKQYLSRDGLEHWLIDKVSIKAKMY